jgi:hypothetical protein
MTNLHITRTEPDLDSPAVIVGVPEQGFGKPDLNEPDLDRREPGLDSRISDSLLSGVQAA